MITVPGVINRCFSGQGHAQDKYWCFLRVDRITELPPCFFTLGLHVPSEHSTWVGDMTFRSLFWIPRALCKHCSLRLTWVLSPLPGSHRKLPPPRANAGPQCGSVLALHIPGWGQGGWTRLWKAKQGAVLGKGQSCSLDGRAAVAEELVDDRWVSHSRRVPQVMVILSDLPKYPPHDFP